MSKLSKQDRRAQYLKRREQDPRIKWFNTVFYPQRKTGRAVRYEDGVLPGMRQEEITLFTPWGPRYKWQDRGTAILPGDREMALLRHFAGLLAELQEHMYGKSFRWIFLGADLYGTRINGLPEPAVGEYFDSLSERLREVLPMAEFRLWSEFDREAEPFRDDIRVMFDQFFHSYVGIFPGVLQRARVTARYMNGGSAREYLIERLAEGMLIGHLYRPIKMSCVVRSKDDGVDWTLPRLYMVPEELHAPWL